MDVVSPKIEEGLLVNSPSLDTVTQQPVVNELSNSSKEAAAGFFIHENRVKSNVQKTLYVK